ncbi:hypothetical protein PUN28_000869 [Cardiocondyla obscurior]|uniref:Uncharacterized protein n=1 Tax=Cardiocondyla obscurior TaxID=286306 RepID=A0AAW2H243_9HYME
MNICSFRDFNRVGGEGPRTHLAHKRLDTLVSTPTMSVLRFRPILSFSLFSSDFGSMSLKSSSVKIPSVTCLALC